MGEVFGRNGKAWMIRQVEHWEVKISVEEEREERKCDSKTSPVEIANTGLERINCFGGEDTFNSGRWYE